MTTERLPVGQYRIDPGDAYTAALALETIAASRFKLAEPDPDDLPSHAKARRVIHQDAEALLRVATILKR